MRPGAEGGRVCAMIDCCSLARTLEIHRQQRQHKFRGGMQSGMRRWDSAGGREGGGRAVPKATANWPL